MRILRSVRALQAWRRQQIPRTGTIGFVPTMGALHEAHRHLIQRARHSCQTVVVSIFVNPLQFGPTEDYKRYPRSLKADTALCRAEGVDVLFVPSLKDIYPPGFQTRVTVTELANRWEGEHRPTHFQGVVTVVFKLLNLVTPGWVFLGQKDYQQTLLVRQLSKDLHLDVNIAMCPTVRERDGLALSSRNQYLTATHRRKASLLYQALKAGKGAIQRNGLRKAEKIRQVMLNQLSGEPLVSIEYLAVCDAQTLEPLHHVKGRVVLLGAICLSNVRLIDNVVLRVP